MKSYKNYLILILILFMLLSTSNCKKTPLSLNLNALELIKKYESNPIKTNKLYLDKVVDIEGVINSITLKEDDDKYYVSEILFQENDDNSDPKKMAIRCFLKEPTLDDETYRRGKNVIIKGRVTGVGELTVSPSYDKEDPSISSDGYSVKTIDIKDCEIQIKNNN